MTIGEIATAVGGRVLDADPSTPVTGEAFIDSRAVTVGGLFVAIKGERADGHDHVAAALAGGAASALVSRPVEAPAVLVDDTVAALGSLANHVLGRLPDLVVIGITGSSGKTSVKDILAQLLEPHGETVAPVGSFNNEIGVPLTALRATTSTRFLVSEMGARGVGHIAYLADMVSPDIAVVLNVGVAHVGEFGGRDQIAQAKGELVQALGATGIAVLNRDDALVHAMRSLTAGSVRTFGEASDADVGVSHIHLDDDGHACFTLTAGSVYAADAGRTADVNLPLVGEHQALNAGAAAAVALSCGVRFADVIATLPTITARSRWRMEVTRSASGLTVINDAYNANPDSTKAALKALADLGHRSGGRTIAVLGEMLELGSTSRDEHDAIGRLAVRLDISQLVVVGDGARPLHLGALLEGSWDNESIWVPDVEEATRTVTELVRPGDVVLVKASRAAGLETVAAVLLDEGPVPKAAGRGEGDA